MIRDDDVCILVPAISGGFYVLASEQPHASPWPIWSCI
jgi:hypothetical protein